MQFKIFNRYILFKKYLTCSLSKSIRNMRQYEKKTGTKRAHHEIEENIDESNKENSSSENLNLTVSEKLVKYKDFTKV